MNLFSHKSFSPLLFSLPLFAAMPACAVELNPDGLGQALIYPYYTVQGDGSNAYDTYLSVVNNTDDAKAVRVNIREGKEGRYVIEFNIFLAPRDTWTAAIVRTDEGAKIKTADASCISPEIETWRGDGQSFSPYGMPSPGGNASYDEAVERMREGYIEMIEMGTIPSGTETYKRIIHPSGSGGPACASAGALDFDEQAARDVTGANTGGLSGTVTLINVPSGVSFTAKAVTLDKFAATGAAVGYAGFGIPDGSDGASPYRPIGLTSANPVSVVPGMGEDALLISQWQAGTADAVSAVLMHQEVLNEFVLEEATASQTSWVVTFPMNAYSDRRGVKGPHTLMSRDGKTIATVPVGGWRGNTFYFEAAVNALDFVRAESLSSRGSLFPSENSWSMIVNPHYFVNGSFILKFVENEYRDNDGFSEWKDSALKNEGKTTVVKTDGTVLKNQTRTYHGMPVVGFAAYTMTNAFIPLSDGKIGRSIYGVTVPHSYRNKIE